jgi:predicted NBD/HSP70 family sugar kinase
MYLLIDIGGTKTRVAGTVDMEKFSEPVVIDTAQGYDEAVAKIAEAALAVSDGIVLRGAIVGCPSTTKNLPQWKDRRLGVDLSAALHTDVRLENDTALVGLGEATYGAGKGAPICVYYTVSTGVNGVRIVDGKIDVSRYGFEIGGQILGTEASANCLEDLVSGAAIGKRYGMHPRDLGKDNPLWEELAFMLAIGVHNTILHWSPDRVVIGGSMMNEIGIPVPRVEEHVKNLMQKFSTVPEIVHSSLSDMGGLWGGLALLRQQNAKQ